MKKLLTFAFLCCALAIAPQLAKSDVKLVEKGKARVAIYVAPSVMEADKTLAGSTPSREIEAETQRRRLRESVNDLAFYLQKMSGAKVGVLPRVFAKSDKTTPILIGEYARQKFGAMQQKTKFHQGFRVSVSKNAIGLQGESDEATSYAIYEILDRLGCRWFMPGAMGESIPQSATLRLPESDVSTAPSTAYRGIWYADEAFKRRNRLGGFLVQAGHGLEGFISPEQREAHPEWRAIVGGKPHARRLKWSIPAVADAIADTIIAQLDKQYVPSISLSADDGADFDESDDRKIDGGDWDPSINQVSITDRYLVLCNRIAEKVTKKYPDMMFGFLAYGPTTRPPVREKVHPNLVPQIAPITYCRAHAMTDDNCPSRPQLKPIIEGWGRAAPGRISYYNYMFHLAEVSVPYPMMHQMSEELSIILNNGIAFWQPETIPNFEEVLPGLWLSMRLSWNKNQRPEKVLDEFFNRFYGGASAPMRRYWQTFDDAWTNVPEHAGSGWGHLRRFTPGVLQDARSAMNDALQTAQTPMQYQRVKLQDESLRQFERFMQMRRDISTGNIAKLDLQSTQWLGTQISLADEYTENFAFSKVPWTPDTISGMYFKAFFDKTYRDAVEMAKTHTVIGAPLREWKYQIADEPDGEKRDGEALGWHKKEFSDADWKTTDLAVDTWFALGLHDYYGSIWYRQNVTLPQLADGKKLVLWLSSIDGTAKVFVNGKMISTTNNKGEKVDKVSGYATPFSFDITAAAKPGEENQIAILATHPFLNELGVGGLLGPVYLFGEK